MKTLPGSIGITSQLRLRPWQESDAPGLAHLLGNPAVTRFLSPALPFPYGEEEARDFIRVCIRESLPERAIIAGEQLIGGIGARISGTEADIGYWLGEPFWGYRYMRQALDLYLHLLPDLAAGLQRVTAKVYDFNPASQSVLMHCGFTRTQDFQLLLACDGLEHPILTFTRPLPATAR